MFITLEKIFSIGQVYSACFLEDNNQIFVIACHNLNFGTPEAIKVYDLDGKKIKELDDIRCNTNYVDCFYDKKLKKTFIIRGNNGNLTSYDYTENKRYKDYYDEDMSLMGMMRNRYIHFVINVKNEESNDVQLIASHSDSNIRIWDFYAGFLKKKIKIENWVSLGGICLWKNKYLFSVCKNGTIKYVDLENGKIIGNMGPQSGQIINIEKVNHPVFGTCLLTQSLGISKIKFWINQSNINI